MWADSNGSHENREQSQKLQPSDFNQEFDKEKKCFEHELGVTHNQSLYISLSLSLFSSSFILLVKLDIKTS